MLFRPVTAGLNKSKPIGIRLHSASIGALFLLFLLGIAGNAAASPRFGLWVEAEGVNRPWQSKVDYDNFVKFSSNYRFTDFFCQVYRGGRSWFPSIIADDTPYRQALSDGVDPLSNTLRIATEKGQRVHAWVNVLRVYRNPNAPLVHVVGKHAILKDSSGTSLLEYNADGSPPGPPRGFTLGTHGLWLDASEPLVRNYIVQTIRDVATLYPDLDGIHLDMVRYPMAIRTNSKVPFKFKPGFGYSMRSVSRFYQFSGRKPPEKLTPDLVEKLEASRAWSAWRRAQVTLLVYEIREMLQQVAPHMELSAAVIANQDRAYYRVFQDWPTWLAHGLVDTVVPMNYTRKSDLFTRLSVKAVKVSDPKPISMGVGAWLMVTNPKQLAQQGRIALNKGARGVTLFSYSNLYSDSGRKALSYFQKSVFSSAE